MIATVPRFIASKTEPLREVADFWVDISDNKPVIKYWNGEWFPVVVQQEVDLSSIETKLNNKLDRTAKAASATIADKLSTPRNIALTGSVVGSAAFDGSGNISINTSIANATTTAAGLMSAEDKAFLDTLKTAANEL